MKAIEFKGWNVKYAEHQPYYRTLPAYCEVDGTLTTCWGFSWLERLRVLFTGRIYLRILTFNNRLQPVDMFVEQPVLERKKAQGTTGPPGPPDPPRPKDHHPVG